MLSNRLSRTYREFLNRKKKTEVKSPIEKEEEEYWKNYKKECDEIVEYKIASERISDLLQDISKAIHGYRLNNTYDVYRREEHSYNINGEQSEDLHIELGNFKLSDLDVKTLKKYVTDLGFDIKLDTINSEDVVLILDKKSEG